MNLAEEHSLRTNVMYNNMNKKKWMTIKKQNGKSYLCIDNKAPYLILEGSVTNFCSETMVSVGASLEREIILFDPNSVELQQRYQLLLTLIRKENRLRNLCGHSFELEDIIDIVIKFAREQNFNKRRDLDNEIKKICDHWKGQKYQDKPIISLDDFLVNGVGLCRHHALFVAFLLSMLMQKGIIPLGKIHHHRDNVTNGAHVFVIYQPFNKPETLFLIDSLWNIRVNILGTSIKEQQAMKAYGSTVIEKCKVHLSIFLKPSYKQITSDKEKKYFIRDLLDLDENSRREILNKQYAQDNENIYSLYFDLTRSNKNTEYQFHANYQQTKNDLARIYRTCPLQQRAYCTIQDREERQQFVLGLLNLSNNKCAEILALQCKHTENLIQLKVSLNSNEANRKPLYQKFKNYDELNNKINRLIEEQKAEKFLQALDLYIRRHSWQVGPQLRRCVIEDKVVPKHVFKQHQEIIAAHSGEKNWVEAKRAIVAIGKRESSTHNFFRKNDTKEYYNLFQDENLSKLEQQFSLFR